MSPIHRAAAFAALLAGLSAYAGAQQAGNALPPALPASAAAAAKPAAATYRSAFEGYRSFNDQPVLSWRESNDLVRRIGGWQSYAREGQGGPAAGGNDSPASATPTLPKPAAPAASAAMPGAHSGHKMP